MSSKSKETEEITKDEVFEIIELAIDDLELLTQAFDVINEACQDMNNSDPFSEHDEFSKILIH